MSSTKINLGKVALTPKGQWSPTATYERLDIVSHNGSSYIVLKQCTGITPIEGEYYALLAERGEKGDKGDYADPVTLSFNGRTGAVVPASGDYTPDMVGTMSKEKIESLLQKKGNKNILHNWYFRNPVNRNGMNEYGGRLTLTEIISIDRWVIGRGEKVTLLDEGIKIECTGTDFRVFYQKIDPTELILGRTYTVSVLVTDVNGTSINLSASKHGSTSNIVNKNITEPGIHTLSFTVNDTTPILISCCGSTVGDYVTLCAAKLEFGNQQTLAVKNESDQWEIIDIPDFGLQYALCSQYGMSKDSIIRSRFSNPNLLINWYFVDPINQRGQMEYTKPGGYTIDRFIINPSSQPGIISIVENVGIKITSPTDGPLWFSQYLELLTLIDIYATASLLTADNELLSVTANLTSSAGEKAAIKFSDDGGYLIIYRYPSGRIGILVRRDSGYDPVIIKAIKFEIGEHQTLAYQDKNGNWILNDPQPYKELELEKCQNYFRVLNLDKYVSHQFGLGMAITNDSVRVIYQLPKKMRTTPTVSTKGKFNLALNMDSTTSTLIPATSVNIVGMDSEAIVLRAYGAVTKGNLYSLVPGDVSEVGQIFLDAERY